MLNHGFLYLDIYVKVPLRPKHQLLWIYRLEYSFFPFVLVSDVFLPCYCWMMNIEFIISTIYGNLETNASGIPSSDVVIHRLLGLVVKLPLGYATQLCGFRITLVTDTIEPPKLLTTFCSSSRTISIGHPLDYSNHGILIDRIKTLRAIGNKLSYVLGYRVKATLVIEYSFQKILLRISSRAEFQR